MATDNEHLIKEILDQLGSLLKDISLDTTPPLVGQTLYRKITEITGNPDPYRHIKADSTAHALALYPSLKEKVRQSADPLMTAVRLAIAGNVIDFGACAQFDIDEEIRVSLQKDFGICHYREFKAALATTREIMYIGDNAGETVFDRILIEQMNKPTVYVVREVPVINDATIEDAIAAGIDTIAEIKSSGTSAPGTILNTCSRDFVDSFARAPFIIAKGQGNYEGLSDEPARVFFLLKAKCPMIARNLGVEPGDIVLKGTHL